MSELSNGISVTNQCYNCMQLDTLCVDCQDLADARATNIAHEIVDEGNMQYKRQWLRVTEPSGHDWVSSNTVQREILDDEGNEIDYVMRLEYTQPIVQLQDGGVYEELWELDDMRQRARETECQWCHILTPKAFNDCQSCDKPLEGNVR